MISKEMYHILSNIPLPTEAIHYDTLKELCGMQQLKFDHLLIQARSPILGYIFADPDSIRGSIIALTEKGIAELEDYEEREKNKEILEKSLVIAERSLQVAETAKTAAIASAITSVVALFITFLK